MKRARARARPHMHRTYSRTINVYNSQDAVDRILNPRARRRGSGHVEISALAAIASLAFTMLVGVGLGVWCTLAPDRALALAIELGHEIVHALVGELARQMFGWLWAIIV